MDNQYNEEESAAVVAAPKPEIKGKLNALFPLITHNSVATENSDFSFETIKEKEKKLNEIFEKIKTEFAGLNTQIDEIKSMIRPWYILPQAQRRPLVISLWGMTGVGKTSFINQLIKHLEFQGDSLYVDLAKASGSGATSFADNYVPREFQSLNNKPAVFFFDEIHNVRTVDMMGGSIDRPQMAIFWNLIDSGILHTDIEICRQNLVYYTSTLDQPYIDEPNSNYWAGDQVYAIKQMLSLNTTTNILKDLAKQNPREFLEWVVERLQIIVNENRPYDYSKALIFVAGNLDEVFTDSYYINPDDMNAEDLFSKTSKVGLDKLKQALMRRFRPEQVARLGSLQVVFPSLSKEAFLRLIEMRLADLSGWIERNFKIKFHFNDSVKKIIFNEGVIPAQGARPVLSTITELVDSKVTSWLLALGAKSYNEAEIIFNDKNNKLELISKGQVLSADQVILKEEKLPKIPYTEEFKSLLAVHEAGHAVAGIALQGRLPVKVLAGSVSWHRGGPRVEFAAQDFDTVTSCKTTIGILLAGTMAEQMIFGPEHYSLGNQSDLQRATIIASTMIARSGMGAHLGVSALDDGALENLTTLKLEDDQVVEKILQEAKLRVKKILVKQRPLLDAVVNELLTKERLTNHDMVKIVRDHYKGTSAEIESIINRKQPKDLEKVGLNKKPKLKKVS